MSGNSVGPRSGERPSALVVVAWLVSAFLLAALVSFPAPADALGPVPPVALGSAGTYSALGWTGLVNSLGPTVVSGDIGLRPGITFSGFGPDLATVGGVAHIYDVAAVRAQEDLLIAYDDAKARRPSGSFAGDQIGKTFTPGVYFTGGAFALTGTLTLDGLGDPDSVFVFQVDAALNTAASSHVLLTNGAQASHVFWQVNGAAGTGASSTFAGTILAFGAITVGNLGVIEGAALSRGVVTLSTNTITTPIVNGGLSITVPAASANLGSRPNTLSRGIVSASLVSRVVSDFTVPFWDSGVCLLLPRYRCAKVMGSS
jgi:Ice-binding-like